jgi:tRNA (guanine37-N1)-methyltransferase
MRLDIVSIFPDFFEGPFQHGILRRARETGLLRTEVHDLRQFTRDRHRTVDDRPFGGEEGMVLKPEPIFEAVEHIRQGGTRPRVILLSAQGRLFRQPVAARLAQLESLVLICGRYEGVDERVAEGLADEEISIGDFVLSGGELAAAVIADTVARLLPGALGNSASAVRESFSTSTVDTSSGFDEKVGLLDCAQYTRPAAFRDMAVPEALLSGNHQRIAQWRKRNAFEKTWKNRPDLLLQARLDEEQQKWLEQLQRQDEP